MMLSAGRRDRLITFQRRVAAVDPVYGTKTSVWEDLPVNPHAYAEVRDVLPSRAETLADGISITRRPSRIRMLYRADITADMRIKIDDRVMQIVAGPAMLGRRAGLEMMVEELSTSGEEP